MALKRAISSKWKYFLPVAIIFWSIFISMAIWQIIRVREEKFNMIYDQLSFFGQRVAYYYDHKEYAMAENFMEFGNKFYAKSLRYDPISVIIIDSHGKLIYNLGDIIPGDELIPYAKSEKGIVTIKAANLKNYDNDKRYVYYITPTEKGGYVCSLLPYSRILARSVAGSTTKFWVILFGLAIIATITILISTEYFGRNIKLLTKFAISASQDPHFVVNKNSTVFPHDELGEISRQIVDIYNQRIKEMERREREHQVAIHAIEEKNRVKKELTSNISHELKTPAGVIQGYLDTIVDNADMDFDTRERFIYKAWESAHRLTALITDITAITKLENGGKLVNVSDVNMHELAYSFSNYLEDNHLLPKEMTFSYDIPLSCVVKGNESLLFAVLTNFTKNAIAYSQGSECHFEMSGEDENFFYFKYYDNGVGIAPEHLVNIFERFYRVNSGRSRKAGGTGLGLSIVEITITSFGGQIKANNRQPSGLEFSFSLPKYGKKSTIEKEDEPEEIMGDLS